MSLKMEFVGRAVAPDANISALCREYGITRQTGHKWLRRFERQGPDGLEERSRRPQSTPLGTAEDMVVAIVEAREAHPRWGAHKLRLLLARRYREQTPSERTIARVLDRFDMVRKRKRRPHVNVVLEAPCVTATAPNDVWTVDFKGWWRARNKERCEPLTVRDAFSRKVLAIVVLDGTKGSAVREVFERLFRRYGVPRAIQCDNGTPFVCVRARGGLSVLSAWWVSLGIELVRSRAGCPQDNGGHERMHRDMAADLEFSPAASRRGQQLASDKWRYEFNYVRPHDAIGGKTPAEVYTKSSRRMCPRVALYPDGWSTRTVNSNGCIKVGKVDYFVSQSLSGHRLAFEPIGGFQHRLWFYELDLGLIEIAPQELPSSLLHGTSRRMGRSGTNTASSASTATTDGSTRKGGRLSPTTKKAAVRSMRKPKRNGA
jgi:transposase InsO family protein